MTQPTRVLPLEGTFNCRDLGGYLGAEGRTVKWGKLLRSDALDRLTDADRKVLTDMGLRTVVDFRSQPERESRPNRLPEGICTVVLNPHAELAGTAGMVVSDDAKKMEGLISLAKSDKGPAFFAARRNAMAVEMRKMVIDETAVAAYRDFLALALREDAAPLLFHCRGGKDRTGWAAALLLLALGCGEETVMEDYLLTGVCNAGRNEARMAEYRQFTDNREVLNFLRSLMEVEPSYLGAALEALHALGGCEAYLREYMDIDRTRLTRLRELYLEEKEQL